MRYHIALTRRLDLAKVAREADLGRRPRHVIWSLSQRLGARIWEPGTEFVTRTDRLCARVFSGRPQDWAFARRLAKTLTGDDLVYTMGESIGLPLAIHTRHQRQPPRLAMFAHNVDRPRARLAIRLAQPRQRLALCITNTLSLARFLVDYAGMPATRVRALPEHTDTSFFTPGEPSPGKSRAVVASVGLEVRDHATLAAAVADLPADVRVTSFSADARARKSVAMPANVTARFYEWPELVQLYRDADVVAIALRDTMTAAGMTTLAEALACRRPVVITRTTGLAPYLDAEPIARTVAPGDSAALRTTIAALLDSPREAEILAERGHGVALRDLAGDHWVDSVAALLSSC